MLHNTQLVLNQVLVLLFPIWIYHLFFHRQENKECGFKPRLLFVLSLSLILTLIFSVNYSNKLIYDLKLIPIMIAFLYGNGLTGFLLLIIVMGYKIAFQDGNPVATAINFAILGSLLILIAKKFMNYSVRFKVILISALHWIITLSRVIWLIQSGHSGQISIIFIFSLIAWGTLLSVIFIFENLKKQVELEHKVKLAERYDVIGQLAASVAHEVRNPMTAVRGFLQLMKSDDNLTDAQRRYMDISIEELNHSQAILSEYLSLAKPANTEIAMIDLKLELNKIIELMKSYTNLQAISISSQMEENLFIKADSSEIKQVFVNLLKNSIEAIGQKGEIHVTGFKKGNWVFIEIADTGSGMSEEQLKYLGTPFYSTKEKGTGVGLSVSYKIIHSIKGNIKVESRRGEGTKFIIQLPAYQSE
ncbi:GHKL domain-containing protein [Neobacillus notoginsengisoli]|uniref:histidine kinase n=1 Tax=Neobacillus notoginsengisoli TaxID=1578198 RepID=A0A417YW65_9BACI|nr:ATP-binding protein [Neobacillus notoginsengisoli]RHW41663.1 GHKL domain-containing protein [Neobacillus notoginsengisoli]